MPDNLRVIAGDFADPAAASAADKKKKKKVRSAWISFVSRILAQLIGALATVTLGVVALHRYQPAAKPGDRAAAPVVQAAQPATAGRLHVAVLPFENYSGDARQDHLADALTDGVVSELSRAGAFGVVSRTSSMRYRGAKKPVPEIGRELGVDLVVEGSFVREGTRVRVIAQLIDARRDEHLWTATYENAARGAVALQAELASAIASDLDRELKKTAQWQAALPESRNVAPATGVKSQR